MPPSTWPSDRQRVEGPADVLGGGDLHDLHQPELDVDVDHGAMGDERERRVAVALAVLVELLGRLVVVLDGSRRSSCPATGLGDGDPQHAGGVDDVGAVDRAATRLQRRGSRADVLEQPLAHGQAGGVHGAAAHPRLA